MSFQTTVQTWWPFARPLAVLAALIGLAALLSPQESSVVSVAMIGNSIQYYNDMPRLLETMANGKLVQDSCLHGDANFESHLSYGNGMYAKWMTGAAEISKDDGIYDWGACTVVQLLFGYDDRLEEKFGGRRKLEQQAAGDDNNNNDDAAGDDNQGDDNVDNAATAEPTEWGDDGYDYYSEIFELADDGTNPCFENEDYYWYLQNKYLTEGAPKWDYVLLNDNSRYPCCTEQREVSLDLLTKIYVPWFRKTKATPIFLDTHAYWASTRDMSGLEDIPTFASVTYSGYKEYVDAVAAGLPPSQQPRIAPVGLAFLLIWEENPVLWQDMIHNDEIHLSPSGTFLEACIVYGTIFGTLPDPAVVFSEEGMSSLWTTARRMVPQTHAMKPYPSADLAKYLYHIAHRILGGEIPKSLIQYDDYESVYFTPEDPERR